MHAIEFEADIENGVIRIPDASEHLRQPLGLNTISINLK